MRVSRKGPSEEVKSARGRESCRYGRQAGVDSRQRGQRGQEGKSLQLGALGSWRKIKEVGVARGRGKGPAFPSNLRGPGRKEAFPELPVS